jgi:superfamily II DNA or RNA helicase
LVAQSAAGFHSHPMLRLFLPPNLTASAARDGIAVRVELDRGAAPGEALLPALALLQRWCATPVPPAMIQLTRRQLRELVDAVAGQPVFRHHAAPAAPLPWDGTRLPGVSELLADPAVAPAPPSPPAPARPAAPPRAVAEPMRVDGTEHYLSITLPGREHANYAAALDLVKSSGFLLEPSNRRWWLRDRHKTLNFLAAHRARLEREFGAEFTENFLARTAHLQPAEVEARAEEADGGYAVTLAVRAGGAPELEIQNALATNRGYLEAGGKVHLLDVAALQRLAAAQQALAQETAPGPVARRTLRVPAARAAELQDLLEELSPAFAPPESWRKRSAGLKNLALLEPPPLSPAFAAQLRSYQRLGTAWLWHLHRHGLGGILADEMGLGKTLQALGLLAAVRHERPSTGPALVVAPASLLENWRREAARFTPQLKVLVHHGAGRASSSTALETADLVVTSYGTLARDRDLFVGIGLSVLVADEAQHVKNRRSQNAAALRSLRAPARFLLTGTPLENSLDDLRSLFEVILPGFLPRLPAGLKREERTWHDQRLRLQTAPYILRRTKQSVAPELPAKLEQVVWCEPTPGQAALYRRLQEESERELLDLEAGGASEARVRFAALTQLLRLRQICCDPRLVTPDAPSADSAKLETIVELLDEAIDDGHRVLVFSQFTALLDLLGAELAAREIAFCRLDGSMAARQRQAEVDRFQNDATIPVFLLSLKAGGTGLNLTAADTVVHFDPWWNPAAEAQATDRAHRIGQTRIVTSYRLIVSGTVEEKVLGLQESKRALLADVFEASDAAAAKLSVAELKSLL